jgi:pSer/pThr/pTyr-binding forkhead associated (FHA) protein
MPRLIAKLPGGPKTIPLGDEALTIGRTNDNKLPLDADGVSRKHAQILFVGKGYEVVDLGSRNGTKVNGQKVPRAILKSGDVVHIGGVDLVYEDDAPAAGASSGLEVEEFDLGAAASGAPAAINADPTRAFSVPGAAPAGECLLRVIDGERKGTDIALKGPRTTFGRRSSNTVTFSEAGVSGVHCEISREPNGYVLRDLGSTNGTIVDGEPVVETLLRHNSRIRMGAQRMVFVDPTVADIESTLATGDDSEWGLMRGEIDVTAARGRGGATALLVSAVVVAAAAGAGWWVVQKQAKRIEVADVKDNRISDYSFDGDGVVRWFSPEEEGAKARIVGSPESPRGASGVRSLEVAPAGEGACVVEYSAASQGGAEATVSPDAVYEVSAKVGGGTGAVVVVWTSSKPGLVREVSTPAVQGGPSWPSSKAIVTAPAQATAVRIRLLASGGSPAVFDDVVFRRAEGAAAPALDSGDLRVRIDAGGFLEAVRGSDILLMQGGVAPSVDASVESLLGAALAAPPAHSGAALTASGTMPGGAAFDVSATAVGGGAVLSCVPKGGAGAFTATCPGGLGRGAVTLVLEKSALVVPEGESFQQAGVRKIIVGTAVGPAPFVLSAPEGSAGFAFSSKRTGRGLRIQLAPAAGAGAEAAAVRLSVDLSQEKKAAEDLLLRARDAESNKRMGTAAARYEQLALEFHYLPEFRDPALKASKEILEGAKKRLDDARGEAKGARRFRSMDDMKRLVRQCLILHKEFEDHGIGTQAKELAEEIEKDLGGAQLSEVEARAEMLYRRSADYGDAGKPALQLILLEEILRIAPPTDEHRVAAEGKIEELRRAMEERRRTLFQGGK